MAEQEDLGEFDLDNATLDDIEDLPGFTIFPTGAYQVVWPQGMEEKKINDKQAIDCAMELQEILEFDEKNLSAEEKAPRAGDICTIMFMMNNKFGRANYKQFAGVVQKYFSDKGEILTLRQANERSKGMQFIVIIKRTYDDKKDRFNARVKKLAVL